MVQFTPEEILTYQEKQKAKLSEAQKEQAQIDADAHKAKRAELESTLKQRFIAAGGRETEWTRHKDSVVSEALIAATLTPIEEEPEQLIPAPLAKSKYMK